MKPAPSRPLRVAIVVASPRIIGGHAVQAQRMLDGWRDDADVEAWIVPIDPLPPRPLRCLTRIKFVRTFVTQLLYWPLLIRELRRADVVHIFSASFSSFLLAPLPATVVARILGKAVVLNYHSGEARDHLARSAIARHTLRRGVDVNVVPSAFLRDVLASFDIPATAISNTIDVREFPYRIRDPLRPKLLSTRNFEANYNLPCTLRAFAIVQARHADATLTLVGGGSQEPILRELSSSLGLRNVVFAGRIPPRDIHRYYDDADLYVQTPAVDNMPLSMIEAFASGLPVVSTDVGGVPALLQNEVHGLLAPPDDSTAVAACVLRLLEQPDYARQLAAAAQRTCAAYQWPAAREGWLTTYRLAVARRGGKTHGTAECDSIACAN
jgi:glycosyltransferase involved in cell wall biosynthesis